MGRATVRSAIADFFPADSVPFLGKVYRSEPRTIPGDAFYSGDLGSGAAFFIFLGDPEHEVRESMPRGSGRKRVTYGVTLVGEFRSTSEPEDAMDDYDTFVDGLKARIRSDPTFGRPSVIFQAGEGNPVGSPDIVVRSRLPVTKGSTTRIWCNVSFTVIEFIVA